MGGGLEAEVFGAEGAEWDGEGAGGWWARRDRVGEEVVVGLRPVGFCFCRAGVGSGSGGCGRG